MCGYLCVSFNLSKNLRDCFLEMVTRFNILVIIAFPEFSDSAVISASTSFSICVLLEFITILLKTTPKVTN